MILIQCPCQTGKLYIECCQPFINNNNAPTALLLMRSRYTAFVTANASYLYETTQVDHRKPFQNFDEIIQFCQSNIWDKLEIIDTQNGDINDLSGVVEFKAYFHALDGSPDLIHERSNFVKENGSWYYTNGVHKSQNIGTKTKTISKNALCPCKSGKKYKRCCMK